MSDAQEALPYGSAQETKKPRKPRAPKKASGLAKPVTRAQGVAWGALGLALGQFIALALAKLLGVQ